MILEKIKRFIKRNKYRYITKIHYTNKDIYLIEYDYMENVYNLWKDSIYNTICRLNTVLTDYIYDNVDEKDAKLYIDIHNETLNNEKNKLKEHLRECSHKNRMFKFYEKKYRIKFNTIKDYEELLKYFKENSKILINYDPYFKLKLNKILKKKKEIEEDFKD